MDNLECEIECKGKSVGVGDLKGKDNLKYEEEVEVNLKHDIKTFAAREQCVDRLAARAR